MPNCRRTWWDWITEGRPYRLTPDDDEYWTVEYYYWQFARASDFTPERRARLEERLKRKREHYLGGPTGGEG